MHSAQLLRFNVLSLPPSLYDVPDEGASDENCKKIEDVSSYK